MLRTVSAGSRLAAPTWRHWSTHRHRVIADRRPHPPARRPPLLLLLGVGPWHWHWARSVPWCAAAQSPTWTATWRPRGRLPAPATRRSCPPARSLAAKNGAERQPLGTAP